MNQHVINGVVMAIPVISLTFNLPMIVTVIAGILASAVYAVQLYDRFSGSKRRDKSHGVRD